MSQSLTPEQIQQFRDDGYLVIPGFFAQSEVDEICAEITAIVDRYPDLPDGLLQLERSVADGTVEADSVELAVRKLSRMALHNPLFRRIGFDPRLVGIATQILGPDVTLLQTMALMKPPHIGGRKVWHQDNYYFRLTPAEIFGFWIACDDADVENGCMHVVPGSASSGLRPHGGEGDDRGLLEAPSPETVVPVPLQSGDGMIFDSQVCHHTPNNTSQRRRRALQYHYAAARCRRVEDGVSSPPNGEIVVAGIDAEQPSALLNKQP